MNKIVNIKAYSKALKERTAFPIKRVLQWLLSPFKAFNFNYFKRIKVFTLKLDILSKVPFSIVVMLVVVSLSLVVLVANHLRYEFFVDLVTKNFPEAVIVPSDSTGKPLYMSKLDRMFAEFEAEINVGYFLFFIMGLRVFLKKVFLNYNPRKIQVFGRT